MYFCFALFISSFFSSVTWECKSNFYWQDYTLFSSGVSECVQVEYLPLLYLSRTFLPYRGFWDSACVTSCIYSSVALAAHLEGFNLFPTVILYSVWFESLKCIVDIVLIVHTFSVWKQMNKINYFFLLSSSSSSSSSSILPTFKNWAQGLLCPCDGITRCYGMVSRRVGGKSCEFFLA